MRTKATLCFVILFCSFAAAQEFSMMRSSDTLTLRSLTFPQPGNQLLQPLMLLPLDFSDSSVVNNLPPRFLRASMLPEPLVQERVGPLSSLRFQTPRDDRWWLLSTALGYVKAGTAAYLTYRALKKYRYIR